MKIGYKLYEDFSDEGREAFEKAQLEMALLCEANGWCMEEGYDENGKRYLIINLPYEPTEEELEAQALAQAKVERAEAVSKIVVEVDGMKFDGDETSQGRMARSAVAMNDEETIVWVLHDNTIAQVTKAQLLQALRLSGEAQTRLWTMPYEG